MIETIEKELKSKSVPERQPLPSPLEPLARISWNYWWSWSRDGAGCFRELAPAIWEEVEHNPGLLLSRVSE
jgi:starch phosphorylase